MGKLVRMNNEIELVSVNKKEEELGALDQVKPLLYLKRDKSKSMTNKCQPSERLPLFQKCWFIINDFAKFKC